MSDPPENQRLVFDVDRRMIGVRTGKVELGQHLTSAYRSIVARALGVSDDVVVVLPVSTSDSPDDGLTVGSLSMQVTGTDLHKAATNWRDWLQAAAGLRLNAEPENVVLDAELLQFVCGSARCDLFDLVNPEVQGRITASNTDRIAAAIRGDAKFIQDLSFPEMLHGRALRGRLPDAVDGLALGECWLVEDGGFAALVGTDEATVAGIWEQLHLPASANSNVWDGPVGNWIKSRPSLPTVEAERTTATGPVISTSRPFLIHGSIAPACAFAEWSADRLTLWTHSQGIFPLRDQISRVSGIKPEAIEVRYVPSSGCYGHTAADDAAMDAALIAQHNPGRVIRVCWSREDEFLFGPIGAPMLTETSADLDVSGKIQSWRHEIWSGPHGQRPGGGGHVNLLAAVERDPDLKARMFHDLPAAIGGGAFRNAQPLYAIPDVSIATHIVQDLPVRTSSLRGLGAQMNTVAIEAMMDRLATEIGACKFSFRLRHLEDPRAANVLKTLQAVTDVGRKAVAEFDDTGIGIGFGRYKNKAAYAAVATRVVLEDAPRLSDVWAVVDAGCVIDEDGTRNQIEGGILQAASWTLCEGVLLRDGRVDAQSWQDYPLLSWAAIPKLHITIVSQPKERSLGVGECMVGPTSAAIVNAVASVLGTTLADLPLDRQAIISAVS